MNCNDIRQLIEDRQAVLIDVREPIEFAMDHAEAAINVPLSALPAKVGFFRAQDKPVILYCASGNRSGQATRYLNAHGLQDIYNGGGLQDVRACLAPMV